MMPGNMTPKAAGTSLEITLDIIRNADLYAKRLEEMNTATRQFVEEREKLTKATDINNALVEAKQSAESARLALSNARSEAAHIVNRAEGKAAEIVGGAQAQAKQIVQSANDGIAETLRQIEQKTTELHGLRSEADSLVRQSETLTEQLNGLNTAVRSLESQKSQLLDVIAEKQRKFKALMAE